MFETAKLRGRIHEKFNSQTEFARVVGTTPAYVTRYLKGEISLKQATIAKWAGALEIPSGEIDIYFFTPVVHEIELR